MLERQPDAGTCAAEYKAVTRATPKEAPRTSRPGTLYWKPFGRELQYMSLPERIAMTVALYNPDVFAIADQHRLHRFPAHHPLAGRADTQGLVLRPFEGTAKVAHRLGMWNAHPRVYEQLPDSTGSDGISIPGDVVEHLFCYVGDLLLFLRDQATGKPYVVNWTVKPTETAFSDPNFYRTDKRIRNEDGRRRARELRHQLEEEYFKDAGIRTVRVITERIPANVVNNLRRLICRAHDRHNLNAVQVTEMEQAFEELLAQRQTLLSEIENLTTRFSCTLEDCHIVFHQAIWNRRLRVSLHEPILLDQPLQPETTDVLQQFRGWFKE